MQRELIFDTNHTVLDNMREIYKILTNGHFRIGADIESIRADQNYYRRTTRSVPQIRIELPILSNSNIAILDTRFPMYMGDWTHNGSSELFCVESTSEATESLDRKHLEKYINDTDHVITLEELKSIYRPGDSFLVYIFEENLCLAQGTNYGEYIVSGWPVTIEPGSKVFVSTVMIRIQTKQGDIIKIKGLAGLKECEIK